MTKRRRATVSVDLMESRALLSGFGHFTFTPPPPPDAAVLADVAKIKTDTAALQDRGQDARPDPQGRPGGDPGGGPGGHQGRHDRPDGAGDLEGRGHDGPGHDQGRPQSDLQGGHHVDRAQGRLHAAPVRRHHPRHDPSRPTRRPSSPPSTPTPASTAAKAQLTTDEAPIWRRPGDPQGRLHPAPGRPQGRIRRRRRGHDRRQRPAPEPLGSVRCRLEPASRAG